MPTDSVVLQLLWHCGTTTSFVLDISLSFCSSFHSSFACFLQFLEARFSRKKNVCRSMLTCDTQELLETRMLCHVTFNIQELSDISGFGLSQGKTNLFNHFHC